VWISSQKPTRYKLKIILSIRNREEPFSLFSINFQNWKAQQKIAFLKKSRLVPCTGRLEGCFLLIVQKKEKFLKNKKKRKKEKKKK
jgi:hypothetical protein